MHAPICGLAVAACLYSAHLTGTEYSSKTKFNSTKTLMGKPLTWMPIDAHWSHFDWFRQSWSRERLMRNALSTWELISRKLISRGDTHDLSLSELLSGYNAYTQLIMNLCQSTRFISMWCLLNQLAKNQRLEVISKHLTSIFFCSGMPCRCLPHIASVFAKLHAICNDYLTA